MLLPQTLMDVLAGRKTVGTITGDIRLNGELRLPLLGGLHYSCERERLVNSEGAAVLGIAGGICS